MQVQPWHLQGTGAQEGRGNGCRERTGFGLSRKALWGYSCRRFRLTNAILRPKAHGLDVTSSYGEVIQQLRNHKNPVPDLQDTIPRVQSHSYSLLPQTCCPSLQGRASFSPVGSPEDTWVLRRPPLPRALNVRCPFE